MRRPRAAPRGPGSSSSWISESWSNTAGMAVPQAVSPRRTRLVWPVDFLTLSSKGGGFGKGLIFKSCQRTAPLLAYLRVKLIFPRPVEFYGIPVTQS